MNLETFREQCMGLPEVTESFPFGPDALVFKVASKMFAIANVSAVEPKVSLKCDPDEALALRARYAAVVAGYHLNKKHWNTVSLDGSVPSHEVAVWTRRSYDLVVASLKKADRVRIQSILQSDVNEDAPTNKEEL